MTHFSTASTNSLSSRSPTSSVNSISPTNSARLGGFFNKTNIIAAPPSLLDRHRASNYSEIKKTSYGKNKLLESCFQEFHKTLVHFEEAEVITTPPNRNLKLTLEKVIQDSFFAPPPEQEQNNFYKLASHRSIFGGYSSHSIIGGGGLLTNGMKSFFIGVFLKYGNNYEPIQSEQIFFTQFKDFIKNNIENEAYAKQILDCYSEDEFKNYTIIKRTSLINNSPLKEIKVNIDLGDYNYSAIYNYNTCDLKIQRLEKFQAYTDYSVDYRRNPEIRTDTLQKALNEFSHLKKDEKYDLQQIAEAVADTNNSKNFIYAKKLFSTRYTTYNEFSDGMKMALAYMYMEESDYNINYSTFNYTHFIEWCKEKLTDNAPLYYDLANKMKESDFAEIKKLGGKFYIRSYDHSYSIPLEKNKNMPEVNRNESIAQNNAFYPLSPEIVEMKEGEAIHDKVIIQNDHSNSIPLRNARITPEVIRNKLISQNIPAWNKHNCGNIALQVAGVPYANIPHQPQNADERLSELDIERVLSENGIHFACFIAQPSTHFEEQFTRFGLAINYGDIIKHEVSHKHIFDYMSKYGLEDAIIMSGLHWFNFKRHGNKLFKIDFDSNNPNTTKAVQQINLNDLTNEVTVNTIFFLKKVNNNINLDYTTDGYGFNNDDFKLSNK